MCWEGEVFPYLSCCLAFEWGPADPKLVQELLHSIRSIEVSVADFHDQDQHGPSSHQKPRALPTYILTNSYKFSCGKCHLQTSVAMSSSDKIFHASGKKDAVPAVTIFCAAGSLNSGLPKKRNMWRNPAVYTQNDLPALQNLQSNPCSKTKDGLKKLTVFFSGSSRHMLYHSGCGRG